MQNVTGKIEELETEILQDESEERNLRKRKGVPQ